jgi:hypothetical protein
MSRAQKQPAARKSAPTPPAHTTPGGEAEPWRLQLVRERRESREARQRVADDARGADLHEDSIRVLGENWREGK